MFQIILGISSLNLVLNIYYWYPLILAHKFETVISYNNASQVTNKLHYMMVKIKNCHLIIEHIFRMFNSLKLQRIKHMNQITNVLLKKNIWN